MAKRPTKKTKEAPSDSGMFTSPGRAAPPSGRAGSTAPSGMMYAGGTPNFDERTGQTTGSTKGGPTKQAPTVADEPTPAPAPSPAPAPAPEPETKMTFTFVKGKERGDAAQTYLYGQTGEVQQVTVDELRDYFESDEVNRLPEVFGTFDNYLAYMTEREQMIQSGNYDTGNWSEYTGLSEEDELVLDPDSDVWVPESDSGNYSAQLESKKLSSQQAAYNNWINSDANQALLEKYGVAPVVYSNSGDKFAWNGSAYVKTQNEDHAGFADYVKMAMITAVGIMSGGALAPALSGGAAAGTAASIGGQIGASVLSNAITQAITTGSIDPEQLLQTAATAGLASAVSQIIGPEITEALNGVDLSKVTGIEEVDNVLSAMGQTAIRQAVFDGELDMDQIVSSGLFATASEFFQWLAPASNSEENKKKLAEWNSKTTAEQREKLAEAFEREFGNDLNTALAEQQNEAMRNQLQNLAESLQPIYEEAYAVSPEPTGPSIEDVMASSVDDADSELADTTADLTADTTAQPEPTAQITNPFEGDELINGVYYNEAGFPVGISPDATPEQILEQFVNDKNAWNTESGVSVHGIPNDALAILIGKTVSADGTTQSLQGLSDLLKANNLILAQDSAGSYILISGSGDVTSGLHSSLDQDSLLDLNFVGNQEFVPPPTSSEDNPLLDPMDTSDVSAEIKDILLDIQEAPETPLDLEVEVDPFEYEVEPELTPEPPPEPEPVEPVEPVDQDQTSGDAGTASPSPDPTRQDQPSFAPAPTPAPEPSPQPAPAPAPAPPPQEEAPITTGMFQEYFPPEPAPAPAPAPPPAAPPAAAPAPAPSASAPPPPAPGTATGTTPESSAPATTGVGTGSGTGVPAGETYEQGSMIGDARALIEQALLRGATPEYLQENFPQYSDIITEVSSQLGTVPTQQPSVTSEDVEGIVSRAIETIPEGMTPEQVSGVVNEAIGNIEFPEGMTASEVSGIVDEAIASIQFPEGLSTEDVNNIVENAIFGIDFPESATMEDVNRAIAGAGFATAGEVAAGQEQATEERRDLQQAIISAQGDIEQLDANTRQQFEEFGGTVNELFSDVNVDIEALQAGQISQAEAQQAFQQSTEERFGELGSQVGDLGTQIGGLASDVSGLGRGLEGLGEGVAGLGAGLGMGLLGLGQQQQQLAAQLARPDPIPFDPFLKGLSPFQPLTPIALTPQKQTSALDELNQFLGRQKGMLV